MNNTSLTKLLIYPNPARDKIHIDLPHYLKKDNRTSVFNITTFYYQWHSTVLDVYNVFGKLIYSKEVPAKTEEIELDVGSWDNGIYIARLTYLNEVVASAKFVISN